MKILLVTLHPGTLPVAGILHPAHLGIFIFSPLGKHGGWWSIRFSSLSTHRWEWGFQEGKEVP